MVRTDEGSIVDFTGLTRSTWAFSEADVEIFGLWTKGGTNLSTPAICPPIGYLPYRRARRPSLLPARGRVESTCTSLPNGACDEIEKSSVLWFTTTTLLQFYLVFSRFAPLHRYLQTSA